MDSRSSNQVQSSSLPPAQPKYILRGHTAQIHCVHFLRRNSRLLTGDADGWVVLWNLAVKRPVAVWRAHAGSVLGLGSWGADEEKIITHGRDNKLFVWQLREAEEASFSTTLPIEDATSERKQPWLLHSLDVNALNFCSFVMCHVPSHAQPEMNAPASQNQRTTTQPSILIAVPGVQDGLINVTSLPSSTRFATIPPPKDTSTGMLMAVSLHYLPDGKSPLVVAAGYESGHIALWHQNASTGKWETAYLHKTHSQPVMSLDIALELGYFFSSSADAIVARHPLTIGSGVDTKAVQTKHAGQQSLVVREDGKIFATAGWDGRLRVYSTKSMKELAVLKWHKEGCYAAAFAAVLAERDEVATSAADDGSVEGRRRELTVSQQRAAKSQLTHWLAAGSKDGKVSLWEIY